MKINFFCSLFLYLSLTSTISATDIKLPEPVKTGGKPFIESLSLRKSDRTFRDEDLPLSTISSLLWAAVGINRPDGKLTSPTARNLQEISVYLITKEGAYLYDAKTNSLIEKAKGDYRNFVAGPQQFVMEAPVSLVIAADLSKFGEITEMNRLMGAVDAGIVCENINLFCASEGLATVPRATMDKENLNKILNLNDNTILLLNNPVGFMK